LAAGVRAELAAERTHSSDVNKTRQKSITRLALLGLEPDAALIRSTVSQIKSFLFAGQDTTAILIQWLCFELSKASWSPDHARILKKLEKEHDDVFGQHGGPFNALEILGRTGELAQKETEAILGNRLPYTTAFLKEILRLHPPASTARRVPELSPVNPTPVTVKISNSQGNVESVQINGLRQYVSQYLIHRNKAVWGEDAHEFRPDRWLDEEYMAKIPTGAWRPFERGPRNCIGQELAWLEGKVVLCAIARGLEWEKVGFSGKSRDAEQQIPKGDGTDDPEREIWTIVQVTSMPHDGMKMKVRLRQ
jgi:cytochrome P450